MLVYAYYESDTRVQQYVSALVERGFHVDIISVRRKGQSRQSDLGNVSVFRIQERVINEKGLFTYAFRILCFTLRAALFLARRHRVQPYQMIHVHSVPDFLVFAALIPKLQGARVVLDIHDILPEFFASKFDSRRRSFLFRLMLFIERRSAAFADYVIVANELWRVRLVSRSITPNKCLAIGNYPDMQLFFAYAKKRHDGRFLILYPGTLNWHQGVDIAIRAFARIASEMPEAEFHIYGEGPTEGVLRSLVKDLGMDRKVIFHAFLPSEEIAPVMAQADLAVVPKRASSFFGNEAASTKILEFMAVGVPVLVSRTRIDTFSFSDSMVRFFESENEEDLAKQILVLGRDQALRERQVSLANAHVQANNWELKKHVYLDLVNGLIGNTLQTTPKGMQLQETQG
jgi:glycosyltransferase involved in cell wall biosynthesis